MAKAILHKAFGIKKTLKEWARDTRCSVNFYTLKDRIRNGMPLNLALTQENLQVKYVTIFGEKKTLAQWGKDARCHVHYQVFRKRIKNGISPEKALGEKKQTIKAFSEQKSLADWAKDPRCKVPYSTLKTRIKSGIAPETAISSLAINKKTYVYATLNGETKPLKQWARDARSVVTYPCLFHRIKKQRMPLYEAMTTPMGGDQYEAFGESKSLADWSHDSRCKVSYSRLWGRIHKLNVPLQIAMQSEDKLGASYYALGSERKSILDWSKDSRCKVKYTTLKARTRMSEVRYV